MMLFYFHAGDLPSWMIVLALLFVTVVPAAAIYLVILVAAGYLKWKKRKDEKDNHQSAPQD